MLLPRFSMKTILATMTGSALVFVIVGQAVRGSAWALGISMAIGSVVLALSIYALMFLIVWLCSLVLERDRKLPTAASGGFPPSDRIHLERLEKDISGIARADRPPLVEPPGGPV